MKKSKRSIKTALMLMSMTAIGVLGVSTAHADVVLTDFSEGVTAVNHPEGAGQSGVWYDATNSTFGSAAAGTLNGDAAMVISDGGFTNGVYVVFEAVIPADGEYSISADMAVDESGSDTGFSAFQLGVAVGADAVHRGPNPSAVAPLGIVSNYSGLTAGNDSANPIQTLTTSTFTASAGDSVLIGFGTDVTSGGWNLNSSAWSGNTVSVDNIVLNEISTDPGGGDEPFVGELIVDDFSTGVTHVNSPSGAGLFDVWYDSTSSTFGTPSADTLEGSDAMRISDGGFGNGVYAIYEDVFPTDGTYTVEIAMDVVESGGAPDGIRGYQIGVSTGDDAVHRDTALPAQNITGTYIGLTPNDDTANPTQIVVTEEFTAQAGDNLLVSLGTDVESGSWGGNSSLWSGSYMLVDDIKIRGIEVEPPPFELVLDNDDGAPVYTSTGFSTSSATGYNGGTYQFAGTGNNGTATWTGEVPEDGFYELSTIFVAGSNRASVATYEITNGDQTFTATADQRNSNLTFVQLGDFELTAGSVEISLLSAESQGEDTSTVVIADAVRIRELDGPPPIDPPELRTAIFLVFDGLDDVGTIQNYINDVDRKRYNSIAVHARYRGDATYIPNKTDSTFPNDEPRSELVGDVDVIQEFVDRGHAAGLKVFAYVNTNLVTDGTQTDPRPNHIVNQQPDWITYEYNDGNPVPMDVSTEPDGVWQDPALPEVRVYNANIVGDIVANYDVDGVVIDRQRYPDTRFNRLEADYGYHPDAIAQFNAEYDKSGVPDPFDEDWWQFRRDQNTRAMTEIYSTVNAIDPETLVLAYPIGRFDDAQNFLYQDWIAWLDNEVIDIVIPQIYTSSNATFSASAAEQIGAYDGDRFIGVALDTFRPGNDLEGQIDISRTLGFIGQSLFTHVGAGEFDYFDALDAAWEGIAPFPEVPWNLEEIDCKGLDINGTPADDVLVGTLCDELIVAGAGEDEIVASGGDDTIVPDATEEEWDQLDFWDRFYQDDVIDGGEGIDTVDYSTSKFPIRVDLSAGTAESRFRFRDSIGNDSLTGIENIIGRVGGGDVYIGNDEANMIFANGVDEEPDSSKAAIHIEGLGGDDYLTLGGPGFGGLGSRVLGGDGNDEIHGSDGALQVFDGGEGDDTIYSYGGLLNVLYGGPGNDTLDGGDGIDVIFGEEGDDVLLGGPGRDKVLDGGPGNDIIDGGDADPLDVAHFSGRVEDYTVCQQPDGTLIVTDNRGIDGTDTVRNVGRLRFANKLVKMSQLDRKIPGFTSCE